MKEMAYPVVYQGSVKNIRVVSEPKRSRPGRYLFEFTDDYSVFDYGKMPDRIRGKGAAIAMMSAFLFEAMEDPKAWKALFRRGRVWERAGGRKERDRLKKSATGRRLSAQGMASHYLGLVDDSGQCVRFNRLQARTNKLLVRAVPVLSPTRLSLDGRAVWDYSVFHPGQPQYLIPLENVFRFGVPKGSSLLGRLSRHPEYGAEIGLDSIPKEGEWLPHPVLEFFSKLEPMDRHLRLEEALNVCGLTGEQFRELIDLSLLTALFLCNLFLEKDLDLWDGKFEFVKTGRAILLADSITPDELRITFKGTQLSKEPLRQYYKREDPDFCRVMDRIKAEGSTSRSIRREVAGRLGRGPKRLDGDFRRMAEQMYLSLAHRMTESPLLAHTMDLDEVVGHLDACDRL